MSTAEKVAIGVCIVALAFICYLYFTGWLN